MSTPTSTKIKLKLFEIINRDRQLSGPVTWMRRWWQWVDVLQWTCLERQTLHSSKHSSLDYHYMTSQWSMCTVYTALFTWPNVQQSIQVRLGEVFDASMCTQHIQMD